MDAFRAWRDEVGATDALKVARVGVGLFLFYHAVRAAQELAARGYFGDVFHLALIPEHLVASQLVYLVIVIAQILLSVCITVGLHPRPALLLVSLLGFYVILCDGMQLHNNRYALLCFGFLLSFAPCGAERTGLLWAQRLVQVQLSVIYLASGISKWLDADWRAGLFINTGMIRSAYKALGYGVPEVLANFMMKPELSGGLAKFAIASELFLAIGLWRRRTRVFALWWGTLFHLTIQIFNNVEIFTWLMLTIYALFATPDYRARKLYYDSAQSSARLLVHLIAMFDWLARFEISAWKTEDGNPAPLLLVVERDGAKAQGGAAAAAVARCIPLLFPLWFPLAFIAWSKDRLAVPAGPASEKQSLGERIL